jgi:Domain of unknown function (DUF1906)
LNRLSIAFIFACTVAVAWSEAGEIDPGRLAIIDASINTTPYLDAFTKAGIKVIGRYYSRCPQPEIVPEKRLIDNLGEIEAIRSRGFGVLSIYQYFNNQPLKFAGKRKVSCRTKKGESRTIEVTLPGPNCTPRPVEDCKEAEGPPHSGAEEAELDARAAEAQAKLVGQPPGTAIYFGIDFDLEPELSEQVVQYFTIVSNELKDNGYLVGVYGSGAALTLLKAKWHKTGRHAGQPVVDFTWLNAARGHSGAAEFYNRGEWDLFQSRIDLHLPVGTGTAEIDTDIQNVARDYVGFWDAHGRYRIPKARTRAIYDQRRFACIRRAPVREAPSKEAKSIGSLGLGRAVRIGKEQEGFVEVDRNEDGDFDGWTLLANLSPTLAERPEYIGGIGKRGDAACRTPASPATTASVR